MTTLAIVFAFSLITMFYMVFPAENETFKIQHFPGMQTEQLSLIRVLGLRHQIDQVYQAPNGDYFLRAHDRTESYTSTVWQFLAMTVGLLACGLTARKFKINSKELQRIIGFAIFYCSIIGVAHWACFIETASDLFFNMFPMELNMLLIIIGFGAVALFAGRSISLLVDSSPQDDAPEVGKELSPAIV
ncbi:MAG: hypothetical protein WCV85_04215 [Patescibacteria group bacterium]